MDLFGFAPYEERKIARYDDVHGNYISTAYVHDSSDPIETGIHYGHGAIVSSLSKATRQRMRLWWHMSVMWN